MAKLSRVNLSTLEQQAAKLENALGKAKRQTENLNAVMERTRNWGAGIALAGGAALMLSQRLIQVAREGEQASKKLEAMLGKRGEGGRFEEMSEWASKLAHDAALVDDDPINQAAAGLLGFGLNANQIKQIMPGLIGQSRLYGQSLESVSEAFGRAFASGNAGALKRSGVTLSQADLDYVKAATSEVEKQNRMFEVVKKSMDNYALSITQGMSEGEIASNRFAKSVDDAMTDMGQGAQAADNAVKSLGGRILALVGANENAAEGAGWFLTMSGYVMTAGGSVLALVSQIGMAKLGMEAMGISGVASFTAVRASAVAAGTAIWGAIAPLLPLVLAIAAVMAAITAGAVYLQKRTQKQAEAEGDAVDREYYERFGKKEHPGLSFEEWKDKTGRGKENADDTGDPENVQKALANAQAIASGQMTTPAMPTMQAAAAASTGGVATTTSVAPSTADIRALEDALASAPKGKAGAAQRAAIQAQLKAARRAQQDSKASAREKAKQDKYAAKIADNVAERQADIEVATMEESYDTRIAQLEASKGKKGNAAIDNQIARLQAEKSFRAAEIRAKYDDSFGESGGLDVAKIRYQGALSRIGLKGGGSSGGIGNVLDRLRAGGGMAALTGGGGGVPTGGGSSGSSGGTVTAQIQSYSQDAQGGWWVQFAPIRLPQDGMRRAAQSYAK